MKSLNGRLQKQENIMVVTMNKKTSKQWCDQIGIIPERDILDPDGWDRSSTAKFKKSFYDDKITLNEFTKKLEISTLNFQDCQFLKNLLDYKLKK